MQQRNKKQKRENTEYLPIISGNNKNTGKEEKTESPTTATMPIEVMLLIYRYLFPGKSQPFRLNMIRGLSKFYLVSVAKIYLKKLPGGSLVDPESIRPSHSANIFKLFFNGRMQLAKETAINIISLLDVPVEADDEAFIIKSTANTLQQQSKLGDVFQKYPSKDGYESYESHEFFDPSALIKDRLGDFSPLMIANEIIKCSKNNPNIINKCMEGTGYGLLHLFASVHELDDGAAVKQLLSNGVDPNLKDVFDETFVFSLFKTKQPPSIELLEFLVALLHKSNNYGCEGSLKAA